MGENKIKILIVEDEPMVRAAYSKILEKRGYEVDVAVNGKEGLDKIVNTQPDLVFLDLILPEMSGEEVLEDLNKRGFTEKIPIIVLTNISDGAIMGHCLKLGAKDYTLKVNFTVDKIEEKIKKILGE